MNKEVFLDRDGTLNEDLGYTYKTDHYKLLPGVILALKKLRKYKLFIITNQSGIGRGYYSVDDMNKYNERMIKDLMSKGIKVEKVYYCPHIPEDNCDCRKPNPKFIKEAEKEYDLNLKESSIIGDHPADVGTGKNAGIKTVYILTGHGVKHLQEAIKENPDYIAANILQAVEYIEFDKDERVIKREDVKAMASTLKKEHKTIVTINGTFDILHPGHEKILKEAKKQGDVLVVGVNSDRSVKENKGLNRPLNNELNRARMVAKFADFVFVFDEKTPIDFLDDIKPDVHVNGSEYGEKCIEAETVQNNGGRIHIVSLLDGYSSTKIIEGK